VRATQYEARLEPSRRFLKKSAQELIRRREARSAHGAIRSQFALFAYKAVTGRRVEPWTYREPEMSRTRHIWQTRAPDCIHVARF